MIRQKKIRNKEAVSFSQQPHPFPSESPYNIILFTQNIYRVLLGIDFASCIFFTTVHFIYGTCKMTLVFHR